MFAERSHAQHMVLYRYEDGEQTDRWRGFNFAYRTNEDGDRYLSIEGQSGLDEFSDCNRAPRDNVSGYQTDCKNLGASGLSFEFDLLAGEGAHAVTTGGALAMIVRIQKPARRGSLMWRVDIRHDLKRRRQQPVHAPGKLHTDGMAPLRRAGRGVRRCDLSGQVLMIFANSSRVGEYKVDETGETLIDAFGTLQLFIRRMNSWPRRV